MKRKILSLLLLLPLLINASVRVTDLTANRLHAPLGLQEAPRLSWIIKSDSRDVRQTAYHILVATEPGLLKPGQADVWDSGQTESNQSILVPCNIPSLKSDTRYYWTVKVMTNRGESPWAETAQWGTGPLDEGYWRGRWIGWDEPMAWDVEDRHSRLSARYMRKEFDSQAKTVKRATAHISGLGLYELAINGKRVGNHVLTPAPYDYRRTVPYDSYDVTDLINGNGDKNAIGITVAPGRYYTMHQHYKPYKIVNFGYPKARLNLTIEYTDGTTQRIATDETWRLSARGPVRSANEYDGETYDARLEPEGWTKPGYDDSSWTAARRAEIPYGTLRPTSSPGMAVKETFAPISVTRTGSNRHLVDFGQNMAGWVRLTIPPMAAGDSIIIRYAERLNPDSLSIDIENLRSAMSTDVYVSNGHDKGVEWTPRFVYHGFRYADIQGPEKLTPESLTAEFVYDDIDDAGTFECSDPVISAIHRAARYGTASNYKGVPVDCPQRDERQPWMGDHNMGAWGESFMFDNATLMSKWTDDMREAQRSDGCIPDICPALYNYYTPDMTWSSTLPVVCDMLWRQTSDTRPIERNYEAIKKWLRYIRSHHSRGDIITADKYADWCVPPESPELIHAKDPSRLTDGSLIATAYYYKMCGLMNEFATLLGLPDEAAAWSDEADKILTAFNDTFLHRHPATSLVPGHILYPDSTVYGNGTLTANILPLAFGMVPADCLDAIEGNVVKKIVTDNEMHTSCGVIGSNWLMRQLARMGRGDVAVALAANTTYPSYGYMLDKGATTIWELWNGDTARKSMNSCNHVMLLGDLIGWMYQDLAGISPAAPGYSEILLSPDFSVDQLPWAKATYNTPYGQVSSSWHRTPMHLDWDVTVPCNTSALLAMPLQYSSTAVAPADGLTYVRTDSLTGRTIWRVSSGNYSISVPLDPSLTPGHTGVVSDEFLYYDTSFPECHASTVEALPDGSLVAAFFGGTKERHPDCCIWVSRLPKGATEWTEPVIAADGVFELTDSLCQRAGLSGIDADSRLATLGPTGPHFKGDINQSRRKACWNPVLFRMPDTGELLLFYKIGTNVADWTGWLTRSTDGGKTWSQREPLPEGILGPIKNKPEYINGRLLCPSSREGDGWRIFMEYTDDGGKTWQCTGALPADSAVFTKDLKVKPIYAIQPSILRHKGDSLLQILCRSRNGTLAQAWSTDNGTTWSTLTLTDIPNNNSGTDAVTLSDGRHMLVYNNFATLPGTPKGVRTPLSVAVSDDGINWRHVATLEVSPISQYSYPCMIQAPDGTIHILYTWRRQRIRHIALKP